MVAMFCYEGVTKPRDGCDWVVVFSAVTCIHIARALYSLSHFSLMPFAPRSLGTTAGAVLGMMAAAVGSLATLTIAPLAAQSGPAARAAGAASVATTPVSTTHPTLVVFLTIDQMRAEYLDRYQSQWTGGFARLAKGGAVFTNAYHDHATTETAPGHAATLSGRFPRSTGIVLNNLGVGDSAAPLVGGIGDGASPKRFRGTTLVDWLAARDARSKTLSISRKDRAAILPVGRSKASVFWYVSDGRFTTSTYYADTLPTWLVEFNARREPQRYIGKAWTPLLPDSAYAEPDSVMYEAGGTDFVFPHTVSTDTTKAVASLPAFPMMDDVTLDAAMAGLTAMHLGVGPATDVLAISLSTTDAVGHKYGPDSKEIHDQLLRVDRALGVFLDSLYKVRDGSRIIIALTADHGVQALPEVAITREHRIVQRVDLSGLALEYQRALAPRGVPAAAFDLNESILMIDRPAFAAAHVDADSVITAFAEAAKARPGVQRVDWVRKLASEDTVNDATARRWAHAIPADMPAELVISLVPGNIWGSDVSAHHGGPSDLDAHVPVILYGASFKAGRYDGVARVVDMAPTLAAVLGVTPGEPVDGVVLTAALR